MSQDPPAPPPPPRKPRIPRPPSQADIDQVSEAQGLITDDWTGEPEAERPRDPAAPPGRRDPKR